MKLLVIDIQKGITDSRLFNFEAFIDDTIRIIKAARDNYAEDTDYFNSNIDQNSEDQERGFQSVMKTSKLQNK